MAIGQPKIGYEIGKNWSEMTDLFIEGQNARLKVIGDGRLVTAGGVGVADATQPLLHRLQLAEQGVGAARRVAQAGVDGVHLVGERLQRPLHFVHLR